MKSQLRRNPNGELGRWVIPAFRSPDWPRMILKPLGPPRRARTLKGRPIKLTRRQVELILLFKPPGRPYKPLAGALAELVGVSDTTIANIWAGQAWRWVERS